MGRLTNGLAAGAAGTTFLNLATYLDMAVRGRPVSSVPETAVDRLAEMAGIELGQGEAANARRSALGAVLGYATGLTAGAVYGAVAPALGWLPRPARAVAVGLAVMAATDGVSAALGATDPSTWSPQDWASDIVPHVAYGAGTVGALDAMS
jgi:hypothetical protein